MDTMAITGIRAYGYTGFLPEEKALGQWYAVDLSIGLDLSHAGGTDDLHATLNYVTPISRVQRLIEESAFNLVERLAAAIAESVLALDLVQEVRVRLTKESPPIPGFSGRVTVDITRQGARRVGGGAGTADPALS